MGEQGGHIVGDHGIVAHGLVGPTQLLYPGMPGTCGVCGKPTSGLVPFRRLGEPRTDPHRACREELDRRRRDAVEAGRREALAAWEAVRGRLSNSPAVVAVLDLHQPVGGHECVECSECRRAGSYDEVEQVPWPCDTFAAVKEALA